ncbi:serine hydrolase domain-containing protein [Embleya scabrispora]|uniref:serine hydrolase domain-containing protein n=1 Tax=Embleya scabrispora TaxID=159449 RepID=UPI00039EFD56|nr:serine hydrolase domain-containing protein [Embleya scabrispora]
MSAHVVHVPGSPFPLSRRRCCALAVALAGSAVAVGTPAAAAEHRAPTRERLRREAEQLLRDGSYVNAAILARDGRECAEGYAGPADLRTGRPVPRDGQVRIGSATKTFVATVVLQLVAEGRLSLTDPVDTWLPGVVAGNGNDGRRVTVRHLLQHTSGLHNYSNELPDTAAGFEQARLRSSDPHRLVAGAMRFAPSFAPADPADPAPNWEYSNTNYVLAGMIVRRVTGRSWAEEVHSRVVRPLGLADTYAPGDDPTLRAPYAHSYHRFADRDAWVDTTIRNMTWGDAAGELISTHADLDRFFTALLRGRLLPPAQLARMCDTVPMPADFEQVMPGVRYGLGLMRQPLPGGGLRWGHGGDIEGTKIRMGVTGDGRRSAVIVVNGTYADDEHELPAEVSVQRLTDRLLAPGAS